MEHVAEGAHALYLDLRRVGVCHYTMVRQSDVTHESALGNVAVDGWDKVRTTF